MVFEGFKKERDSNESKRYGWPFFFMRVLFLFYFILCNILKLDYTNLTEKENSKVQLLQKGWKDEAYMRK